jgi:hypothetical protein
MQIGGLFLWPEVWVAYLMFCLKRCGDKALKAGGAKSQAKKDR